MPPASLKSLHQLGRSSRLPVSISTCPAINCHEPPLG
jgi:hypothetical protein